LNYWVDWFICVIFFGMVAGPFFMICAEVNVKGDKFQQMQDLVGMRKVVMM
jgi:hypothetical protein